VHVCEPSCAARARSPFTPVHPAAPVSSPALRTGGTPRLCSARKSPGFPACAPAAAAAALSYPPPALASKPCQGLQWLERFELLVGCGCQALAYSTHSTTISAYSRPRVLHFRDSRLHAGMRSCWEKLLVNFAVTTFRRSFFFVRGREKTSENHRDTDKTTTKKVAEKLGMENWVACPALSLLCLSTAPTEAK